jgi:lysozyme
LIPHWEGVDLVALHNRFDPRGVVTVCNGVTNYDWPWLKVGAKFTPAECTAALIKLIPRYTEPLRKCVKGFDDFPPHRIAALTSASYNLGPGTICKSTTVRLLNAGNISGGCNALGNFVKADGKFLSGLFNRRHDKLWGEIAWCLRED